MLDVWGISKLIGLCEWFNVCDGLLKVWPKAVELKSILM